MTYLESARAQADRLREKEHVRILSLETSCDETAASRVKSFRLRMMYTTSTRPSSKSPLSAALVTWVKRSAVSQRAHP